MTTFEIASLIIQGVSGIFVAGGLFYAAKQIRATHDWNRRKAAQDATLMSRELISQSMKSLNEHFSYMTRTDPITCSETNSVFEKHPDVRSSIHNLLNYYEGLARGILQGIYDEEIIKASKRTVLFKAYNKLIPYIRQHRQETASPLLWDHFEALAAKWHREEANVASRSSTDQTR